ncbi:hypothetical protein AB0F43_11015 [Kribbella sp. NPDC023972]|uniref:hypothetical protein n=1 Tax=Kribbella sp. NPDC023972 TaxID=3154795 RepID=UPI0033C429EF
MTDLMGRASLALRPPALVVRVPMLVTNGIVSELSYVLIYRHLVLNIKLAVEILKLFLAQRLNADSQVHYDLILFSFGQFSLTHYFPP